MCGLARVVTGISRETGAPGLPLPIVVITSFFNWVHRVVRWIRLGRIYANSENFPQLVSGHGMRLLFADSRIVKIAAIALLIATRILACVQQLSALGVAWREFASAWRGKFSEEISVKWQRGTSAFCSPSTSAWWKLRVRKMKNTLYRIGVATLKLCRRILAASAAITEAVYAFLLPPAVEKESMNLFFIHAEVWTKKLTENKDLLLSGLSEHRDLIAKMLQGVGACITVDQLISCAKAALQKTEQASSFVGGGGSFFAACAKKWGSEFFTHLGLQEFFPTPPSPLNPFPNGKQKKERIFVPLELITRPSFQKPKGYRNKTVSRGGTPLVSNFLAPAGFPKNPLSFLDGPPQIC